MRNLRQARVAAVQIAFFSASHEEEVWERLLALAVEARKEEAHLVLFPALTGLLPLRNLAGRDWRMDEGLRDLLWIWGLQLEETLMRWGRDMARWLDMYVCPGTVPVPGRGGLVNTCHLFNPQGDLVGKGFQAHVDRIEERLGFMGESVAPVLETDLGRVGFLAGTDSQVPEMGRILSLKGADLLLAPQLGAGGYWSQLAGTWSQIQATQTWGLESFMLGDMGGWKLSGRASVLGPCEATSGLSGILSQADQSARDQVVSAVVDFGLLEKAREAFPIRRHMNPGFYRQHFPAAYSREEGSA